MTRETAHLQDVSMSALKYARLFEGSYLRLAQWCFGWTGSRWSSINTAARVKKINLVRVSHIKVM
jgi:hypothetical protein